MNRRLAEAPLDSGGLSVTVGVSSVAWVAYHCSLASLDSELTVLFICSLRVLDT